MNKTYKWKNPGLAGIIAILFAVLIFLSLTIGIAWWAWSWSTHTIVWFIFVFGSLLGSVGRVRTK